jgi:hypothetical protein
MRYTFDKVRKRLILRCLAERGLEGRTTPLQLYGILAKPPRAIAQAGGFVRYSFLT